MRRGCFKTRNDRREIQKKKVFEKIIFKIGFPFQVLAYISTASGVTVHSLDFNHLPTLTSLSLDWAESRPQVVEILDWHSSRYFSRSLLLNWGDRMRTGVFNAL